MAKVQLPRSGGGLVAGQVLRPPRVRVYTKKLWAGAWQAEHYLRPLQASLAAAPLKGAASFEWLVGRVKYADSGTFAVRNDRELRDYFVKIERLADNTGRLGAPGSNGVLWVGRMCDADVELDGVTDVDSGGSVARARRVHRAYGLEHELDRNAIRGSWVTNDDVAATFVDTPLRFNEKFEGPSGLNRVGNRSGNTVPHPEDGGRRAFVFAGRKGGTAGVPQPWTVADIVGHLLAFYAPPELGLTLGGNVGALTQLVLPRVDLSGRTVFQALNYLIDRRRGLGWCLRLGADGRAAVHVYSVLDEAITFEDATIAANEERVRLNLDALGHLVEENSLAVDTLSRYGKIVVSGERVLACFTAAAGEQLFPGWTTDEQAAYVSCDGATEHTTGGAEALNDQARADVRFDHVFSHFHFGRAPQGKGGVGAAGVVNADGPFEWKATGGNANPRVDETGRIKVGDSPQAPVRAWGHRVERFLPFTTNKTIADAEAEYERPFAILKDPTTLREVMSHSTGAGHDCRLTPLDNHFGVAVEFTPHHRLAYNHWPAAATPTATRPQKAAGFYDWAQMHVTVAVRTDARLQVTVVVDRDGPLKDRVLHVEVPDAELHYAVPGTIKSIRPDATREVVGEAGAVLRDDGERLRRIAAMAKAWYGKERSALRVTVHDLWQQYPVGTLVMSVADKLRTRPVNTPVSQVIYDLVRMRTTVRTNWSELDVTAGRGAGRRRT